MEEEKMRPQKHPSEIELAQEIQKMEDELCQRYCALGKSMVELIESERVPINQLVDQIIRMKLELKRQGGHPDKTKPERSQGHGSQ